MRQQTKKAIALGLTAGAAAAGISMAAAMQNHRSLKRAANRAVKNWNSMVNELSDLLR